MNKEYTIFDNVAGGYTIRYRYYFYKERRYIYKVYQAQDYNSMRSFERNLIRDGYKFVGSF